MKLERTKSQTFWIHKLLYDVFVSTKYSGEQLTISNGSYIRQSECLNCLYIHSMMTTFMTASKAVIQFPKHFGILDLTSCLLKFMVPFSE